MRKILILFIALGVLMNAKSLLPKYYSKVLDNGLTAIIIPMHNKSGVIETAVYYKVGSRDEVMGKSGLAHMLEHLSFKATKNLKAGEFDQIVKGFGGLSNASTGFDYTKYFISSSSKNLGQSLKLFSELMSNLSLKNSEFQKERDVVAEERRWRTDNSPIGYMYFRFFNNAYIYHPYHWTPIGFMSDIKSWKIGTIRDFYKTYYRPSNAIVIISGDIDVDHGFMEVRRYFSHLKNPAKKIEPVHTVEPPQDGAKVVHVDYPSEVDWMMYGFKIPNFEHKDIVALEALSEVLSSGKSSILYKRLVEKLKLTSEVYAYAMALKDSGVFLFVANANSGVKIEEVYSAIKGVIEDIKRGKISTSELEKVKINTKAQFINSLDTASAVGDLFGSYLALGKIEPLLNYEDTLNSLRVKDLTNVAKKYLIDKNSTLLIMQSATKKQASKKQPKPKKAK